MNKDEIAQIMQDTSGMLWGDEAHFQRFAKRLIDIEREACAKLCEVQEYEYWRDTEDQDFTPQDCADAIRARSNT